MRIKRKSEKGKVLIQGEYKRVKARSMRKVSDDYEELEHAAERSCMQWLE